MVRHGATEIGFMSRTGSTQVERPLAYGSTSKCQVGFIRVAPCRTKHNWSKFTRSARRSATHKMGLNSYLH